MSFSDYCAGENRMVDTDAIITAMNGIGMCRRELADAIGVSLRTIRNRLDFGNWSVAEAYKVCVVLGLDFGKVFMAHPENLDFVYESHTEGHAERRGYPMEKVRVMA